MLFHEERQVHKEQRLLLKCTACCYRVYKDKCLSMASFGMARIARQQYG